jgi:signal transduction histidine kinase/ActR/RegA family two-component response regulator
MFLLLAIVLVPVLLVQAVIYQDRFETRLNEEKMANMELSRAVGKAFEQFVEDVFHQQLVIGLALTASPRLSQKDVNTILERSALEHESVMSFAWVDTQGRMIHSSREGDRGIDVGDRSFFLEMRAGGEFHVSDLFPSDAAGKPFFTISRSIRDGTGRLLGVVAAAVDPDRLHTTLDFQRRIGGAVTLIDRNGRLVYRNPRIDLSWEQRDLGDVFPVVEEAIKGKEVSGITQSAIDQEARVYTLTPIDSVGWVAGASRPESEVVGVIRNQIIRHGLLFLAVVAASLLMAAVVGRTISNSVGRLRNWALRVSSGENRFFERIDGPTEVRELALVLQKMTGELQSAREDAEARAAALKEQEVLLGKVLDVLPVGVFIADSTGGIARTNPAVEKIWGGAKHVPMERFGEYKGWWSGTQERIQPQEWAFARAFTNGETSVGELIDIECFDGTSKTVLNSAAPVRNDEGRIVSAVAMTMDMTDLAQSQRELRMAKEVAERLAVGLEERVRERTAELETANRAKSEFLANMSHEIRTPVGEVIGMADVLLKQELPAALRGDLEIVRNSSKTILALLNDLLDLARIEQGKLELDIRGFSLREAVHALARPYEIMASEKGLTFSLSIAGDVPDHVNCDPERLGQVLKNLLSNALKFTDAGSIGVNVELDRETRHLARLRFTVTDTGVGIPEEKVGQLFQSFTQLDPTYSKKFAGVGLGLAISKQLVELMGGKIWVGSSPEKGSTFSFTIAYEKADPKRAAASRPAVRLEDLPPMSILLAEDNVVNRIFLERALEMAGHEVSVAENGRRALELLGEGGFDIVLMDIQMPELDGVEATRRIRSGTHGRSDIPIIALTAYAMKGDREKFLRKGMNGYVTKPVDFEELARVIAEVRGGSDGNASADPSIDAADS